MPCCTRFFHNRTLCVKIGLAQNAGFRPKSTHETRPKRYPRMTADRPFRVLGRIGAGRPRAVDRHPRRAPAGARGCGRGDGPGDRAAIAADLKCSLAWCKARRPIATAVPARTRNPSPLSALAGRRLGHPRWCKACHPRARSRLDRADPPHPRFWREGDRCPLRPGWCATR